MPDGQLRALEDSRWRTLDLPHDWSIEGPYSEKEPAQGSLPTGIGWYRKRFRTPDAAKGRIVTLEFDGIYENGEVWINERRLGRRPYGYSPVAYDVTPYLSPDGENVVAVKVDNSPQSNSRWYSGSGIYRHTWITVTDSLHVGHWRRLTSPRPPSPPCGATVEIKTTVRNEGKARSRNAPSTTTLVDDKADARIQSVETTQTLAAPGRRRSSSRRSRSRSRASGLSRRPSSTGRSRRSSETARTVDETTTPFGIREATFDAKHGFTLNGKHVKLNGVCLHHEAGAVGAAVPERVWERRLELLKAMGCNAIRTSHNPVASEFLDLCDRMGFLVMAEAFDEWKVAKYPYGPSARLRRAFRRVVRTRRDRLRAARPQPPRRSSSGARATRSPIRPTRAARRPCAGFSPSSAARTPRVRSPWRSITWLPIRRRDAPVRSCWRNSTIVGYNYVSRWGAQGERYYDVDRENHPDWRVIGTEHGAHGRRSRRLPRARGRGRIRGDGEGASPCPRIVDVEGLWRFTRLHDYVAGRLHVDRHRLPGRGRLAAQGLSGGGDRHLRLPEGRLLLLPEPVDRRPDAPPLPALELVGSRGAGGAGRLLHELRQRGALPRRSIAGGEGLFVPALGIRRPTGATTPAARAAFAPPPTSISSGTCPTGREP